MMAKHICRKGYIWHIYLFINRIFSLLHHEQYVKELASQNGRWRWNRKKRLSNYFLRQKFNSDYHVTEKNSNPSTESSLNHMCDVY